MKGPVIAAVLISMGVGYWLGTGRSAEELSISNERVSFLGDQLSAYKDRLQGASPDQAAKQITVLSDTVSKAEKKLEVLSPDHPRALDDDQKKFFLEHKEEFKSLNPFLPVFAWAQGDSADYATEFVISLYNIGMHPSGPELTTCVNQPRGILVGMRDPTKPSPGGAKLFQLLEEMKLSPQKTLWAAAPSNPNFDYDIFICGQ